jgi:hypothetical protein
VVLEGEEFSYERGAPVRQKKMEFPGNLHDVSDEIMKVNQKGYPS